MTRRRLHIALDRGSRLPLTMLVAPAGTGKTVLLADWAAHQERSVAWVTGHDTGNLAALLGTAPPRSRPDLVIIDDAHLLPPAAVGRLAELLFTTPYDVRLVIASRYDLPLPISELELRGLGSILRSRDLRFTDDEAAALVHAHADGVSDEDIQLLQETTSGWAAALVLAARAFTISGDSPPPALTERPVLDLLLGETFDTLDERVQGVLLSTFEQREMTAQLAAALSGDPNAGAILADLSVQGLLVTAYSDGHGSESTYDYHPLLVELLRRRAVGNDHDGQRVVAARRRAAAYYAHHGDATAALTNALGASDPGLVAELLLVHGPTLLAAGDIALVASGFDVLPDDYVETHLHLAGVRGLLRRFTGDLTGAVMDAAAAAEMTDESGPSSDALEADVAVLRLWESRYGWYDVDDAIRRATVLVERAASAGEHRAILGLERLAWVLLELAAAETTADRLDDAACHLDEVAVTARMACHRQLLAAGQAHRAVVQLVRGQVQSAARSAEAALDSAAKYGLAEEHVVRAQVVLGLAALSRLDLDDARDWSRTVTEADVPGSDPVVTALREMMRTVNVIEDGRLDEARLALASDPPAAGQLPSFLVRDLALLRLWVALLVDDRPSAESQVGILEESGNVAEAALLRAVGSWVVDNPRATLDAVDTALADPSLYPTLAASAKAFRVILLVRLGDTAGAEQALSVLLTDIAPQHLLQPLAMAGLEPTFMDLLRRCAESPRAHPFASVALDKLSRHRATWNTGGIALLARPTDQVAEAPPRRLEAVINGATIHLTAREADVLDQLALGSSYTEIAQALYITENTVKTHLMSLYRKLCVEKRSVALRVARTVGLL
ncbi:LuxR C-terminal-related transcriptional regulator [Kribbella sp. NPDC004875]|uniref:LuxR C-terminal-related transcriptional regulator n=1 Tax=Kribbella sp. NPDC004875 TaxID=3364107 RepID=UPI00369969E2